MYKVMNNARIDRMLYVLDNFHPQSYFTREDVIKDFMDEKQHVLFDKDEAVAVFTLEKYYNLVHLKRFSILGDNYGKGYMSIALKQLIDEYGNRLALSILPTNHKMLQILKSFNFEESGTITSERSGDEYALYRYGGE